MAQNACCTYDCTFSEQYFSRASLEEWFKEHCKSWCFQLEEGEGGYRHFQTRFSLKVKARLPQVIASLPEHHGHCGVTSKENAGNYFYVMKADTRVDGPWTEKDVPAYVPKQIQGIVPYKWQQQILDMIKVWDTRNINVIIDTKGNNGKSTLTCYACVHDYARKIPLANDYKDILRMVYCMPKSKGYFIDMPRAMKKERLFQFWSALESIKDGYCYDDRYEFKDCWFDCPNIFVFTNTQPDTSLYTRDRWKFWEIKGDELVTYVPEFTAEAEEE